MYHNRGMPNIASILKDEIARVARKQVKAEISALKKSSSQHRSSIAALKREMQALEGQLRRAREAAGSAKPEIEEGDASVRRRFRAGGLASHRRKLGLSAEDYGALVGASGQSVYKWERGDVRPRAKQLEALAAIRGLGKREALARLEVLASRSASKAAARKRA